MRIVTFYHENNILTFTSIIFDEHMFNITKITISLFLLYTFWIYKILKHVELFDIRLNIFLQQLKIEKYNRENDLIDNSIHC